MEALVIVVALGAAVLGAVLVFGITAHLVRWQVGRHRVTLEKRLAPHPPLRLVDPV